MTQTDAARTERLDKPELRAKIIPKEEIRGDWEGSLDLLYELDPVSLPRHVAIIMDGNRRWAKLRGMNMLEGHHAGVRKAREVADLTLDINAAAGGKGIEVLTFYAFSKENWNRSTSEVSGLMHIFEKAAIREILPLHERNMRVRILGDLEDLPSSLQERIREIEELTKNNTGMHVNYCLSYSGRGDILKGIKKIHMLHKEGKLDLESIDEETFGNYLDTGGLPDPDLLIRTSGEMRFSNFLLWQIAYTELWVTPAYWPDFNGKLYLQAIKDFQKRERRYGGGG